MIMTIRLQNVVPQIFITIAAVNKEHYSGIFHHLYEAICTERPDLCKDNLQKLHVDEQPERTQLEHECTARTAMNRVACSRISGKKHYNHTATSVLADTFPNNFFLSQE